MKWFSHSVSATLGDWQRAVRGRARTRALGKNLITLQNDDACAVFLDDQPGDTCLVSFTGIGHGTGGLDVQRPEFAKAGVSGPRFFIIDKTRSWGNALALEQLAFHVIKRAEGRRVFTLGNSMGGFLAILASKPLGATRCLAFSPQWSVDPACMPLERRWMAYRRTIRHFRYPDLSKAFSSDCSYDVVFGGDVFEAMHAERFPADYQNVAIYQLGNSGHEVAASLKAAGLLHNVVTASLNGESLPEVLTQAGIAFKVAASSKEKNACL